jgi:hypothetical protein
MYAGVNHRTVKCENPGSAKRKIENDPSRSLFQQLLSQEIADGKLVLADAYLGHNSQSLVSPSAIVVTVNRSAGRTSIFSGSTECCRN